MEDIYLPEDLEDEKFIHSGLEPEEGELKKGKKL